MTMTTDAAALTSAQSVHFVEPPHGLSETEFALHPIDAGLFALRASSDAVRLFVVHGALLPSYAPEVTDEQAALLGLESGEDAEVYVVVNPAGVEPTVNLLAPIVVNRINRQGAQLVIESGDWSLRAPLSELL